MSTMTDLTVTSAWQLVYTAAGTVTVVLENRSQSQDMLITIIPSATPPAADPPAFLLPRQVSGRDGHVRSLALASGDRVWVEHTSPSGTSRATLLNP